jgi:Asp/Glu/hydantoin racemase
MIYRTRKRQLSYGRPIGILTLEERIPCPPGTPGNPTTFTHPVCYEIVRGHDSASLEDPEHPRGLEAFVAAGRALIERGACAVAGNCGLMIVHQQQLARLLPVPVLLSSLLQLPLIARLLAPGTTVGILASSRRNLKDGHVRLAAAGADIPVAIGSMDSKPHFRAAVGEQGGTLDFERVQAEVVEVAVELVRANPSVGALLFECVDLPPYASAVQEAVGLPVFDITTLIAHACAGLVRRPFAGVY